ncbi:hypothetical protein DL766_007876 [Monosporascus sp. MC13-8B]|uniref:Uncharacterized protein n=1 Tax=Monosporascus cannonballus TaxID=155416 RepID=A0ABY0HH73_9PEZI|nr:hypothetical protein DL763_010242 [Monosporascus cannonballus]RYO90409.1 hypothetical protein DL762_002739 [Monosporascus cannonballus]RYP21704.1 hypothetical protein DL766_007876 [Monosporascus sp. MC13-8B]
MSDATLGQETLSVVEERVNGSPREAGPVLYQTEVISFSAGFFSSGRVALDGAGPGTSTSTGDPGYNAFAVEYDLRCITNEAENVESIKIHLSSDITPRNPESSGTSEGLWMKELREPFVAYLKAMPKLTTVDVRSAESERLLGIIRPELEGNVTLKRTGEDWW